MGSLLNFSIGIFNSSLYCILSDYFLSNITRLSRKSSWYLIHTICNFYIIIHTFDDMKETFLNPINSLNQTYFNSNGLEIAIGLHLFHIYRDSDILDIVDWCHHLISCLVMGTIGFVWHHNSTFNCGLFFMCGLPGGIDYFLLFLVKQNMIEKITEKRINVFLNNWIRAPGILYSNAVTNIGFMSNLLNMNPLVYGISQVLVIINAIYFAQRVTINYGYYTDLNGDE